MVRDELERWFGRYPENAQAELATRFRTENGGDTLAPFFELFLHELLSRFGCVIELHPTMIGTGNRPDFRVIPPGGAAFYLEAVVAYNESSADRGARIRKNVAFDTLNTLRDMRVFLAVSYEGVPDEPPPVATFRKQIETTLATLTDEDIRTTDHVLGSDRPLAKWRFKSKGWTVNVEAFPRSASRTGDVDVRPVAVTVGDIEFMNVSESIRAAVMRKATRYGELDLPFVIAVNAGGGFRVGLDDVSDALFGQEDPRFEMSADGHVIGIARPIGNHNGAWWGPEGARNTRVSSCLVTSRCFPWSVPQCDAALYRNPWGARPYDSALCRLVQLVPGGGTLEWIEGLSVADVFGLPLDWPGPRG